MFCWAAGLLTLLLAAPGMQDQDKPKPSTPREQWQALVTEFNAKRSEAIRGLQSTKGEEQQKLIRAYQELGKTFAARFYQLMEDHPQDAAAMEAAFWIIQNAAGSPEFDKAMEKVKKEIDTQPVKALVVRLNPIFGNVRVLELVYQRALKDEADPDAPELLGWIVARGAFYPVGQKAIDRLIEKHTDHPSLENASLVLARSASVNAEAALRKILEKANKPEIKAAAALGLGQMLAAKADRLGSKPEEAEKVASEAEKVFAMVIEDASAGAQRYKTLAEKELKVLRTIRVGKEAPEITGPDLDGKEFKLSDYRGKVVLLDFWGNW